MKKLNYLIPLFFLFFLVTNNQLFSDGKDAKQWGGPHKHIVREAYKRLKLHLGYDIPELKKHIGDDQNGVGQFNPGGLVVIGAFREDEEDIVYGYSGPGGAYVSFTHFWKADDGDSIHTFFPSPFDMIGSFPNAFEKAKKYIYGNYTFSFQSLNHRYTSSLFDYYKDSWIYRNNSYIQHTEIERNIVVWEIIGRVCHLLADVNTPAHVKNDPHFPPQVGGKYDFYEKEMDARRYNYTAETAANYGSLVPIHYTHSSIDTNTLKVLFYTSAQIADHFNSDDKGGNDYPGSNDPFDEYCIGVDNSGNFIGLQEKIDSLPPVSNNWNFNLQRYEINVEDVAEHSFHYSINATASFLLWCAQEMDIMPFVVPLQYPTIESAVQAALSSNRTVKDVLVVSTHTVNNHLVIPHGINLVILEPSITVNFNRGLNLHGTLEVKDGATVVFGNNTAFNVSGSLATNNATFKFGNNAELTIYGSADCNNTTFTTINPDINWNGIIVNSSRTYFANNTIRYATTGLILNHSSSLEKNIIRDCGTGIHVSNIKLSFPNGNKVHYNNGIGILFSGYARGKFFPYNKITDNDLNIFIESNAHPNFGINISEQGMNSIHDGYSYDVVSRYTGNINAQHNWWGIFPTSTPYSPRFDVTGFIDISNALNYNPTPSTGIIEDKHIATGISLKKLSTLVTESVEGIEEFDEARILLYDKSREKEGETLLLDLFNKYPDKQSGRLALVALYDYYNITGEEGSKQMLLEPTNQDQSLSSLAMYFKARDYKENGNYKSAVEELEKVVDKKHNSDIMPYVYYDLATLYYYNLDNTETGEKYYKELIMKYPDEAITQTVRSILGVLSIDEEKLVLNETITETKLFTNYPNPFNQSTIIKYQLADVSLVSLKVYDVMGREVVTLVNSYQNNGSYSVTFNANSLASGIYFYKLNVGGKQFINKMLLMK